MHVPVSKISYDYLEMILQCVYIYMYIYIYIYIYIYNREIEESEYFKVKFTYIQNDNQLYTHTGAFKQVNTHAHKYK